MPRSQAKASPSPTLPLLAATARRRFRQALAEWFARHGRDLPWRRTTDPYAILVSELMLQQTQVNTVRPYYERWLAQFPTVASLAAAREPEVLGLWQGLGYYARARNLHRAAQAIVATHGGAMPLTAEALHALPGIGRYTAGAVASFAYDAAVPAVDANIARVLARLFEIEEPIDGASGQAAVWEAAALLLPKGGGGRLHNSALMELGALVCVPRSPRCLECPVRRWCAARNPGRLPVKRERRATVELTENCAWVTSQRGVLLERQTGSRWKGLWKLPRLEVAPGEEPLFEAVYPFTHHRVTLRVFAASAAPSAEHEWHAGPALVSVALAAAHRRAVEALLAAASQREKCLRQSLPES